MRLFAKIPTAMALAMAAGGMLVPGCSCGDDGGNPDARPPAIDARVVDAADPADAADPDADIDDLRSGTIAVSQVRVTNDLTALGIPNGAVQGAGVSVSYSDLTTATVEPTVGNNGIGECTVWVYTVGTNAPPALADEGAVTISGTGITPNNFPVCSFIPPLSAYQCIQGNGILPDATSVNHIDTNGGGTPGGAITVLTVPNVDFAALNAIGMVINVTGFTIPQNNGTFMVADVDPLDAGNDSQIRVINFAAAGLEGMGGDVDTLDETYTAPVDGDAGAGGTYALIAGTTPIVLPFTFITDYSQDITVAKAAGSVVPAFSVTLKPSGDTVTLSTSSKQPHNFDVAATGNVNQVFTCDDGTDGDCGMNRADGARSQITGWTISGSSTDGPLATGCSGGPCLPIQMPTPVTTHTEFVCKGSPGADSITLSAAALDAIMATSPTRIQLRLLRVTADITSAEATSIVSGKGFVGFKTVPAP